MGWNNGEDGYSVVIGILLSVARAFLIGPTRVAALWLPVLPFGYDPIGEKHDPTNKNYQTMDCHTKDADKVALFPKMSQSVLSSVVQFRCKEIKVEGVLKARKICRIL